MEPEQTNQKNHDDRVVEVRRRKIVITREKNGDKSMRRGDGWLLLRSKKSTKD